MGITFGQSIYVTEKSYIFVPRNWTLQGMGHWLDVDRGESTFFRSFISFLLSLTLRCCCEFELIPSNDMMNDKLE
jgi:hypothetical protein